MTLKPPMEDLLTFSEIEDRLNASSVRISRYIDGDENVTTQTLGLQQAVNDAISSGRELQLDYLPSGATEIIINSAIAVSGRLRLLGRGMTIRQTVWPNGHFDQAVTAEGSEFDNLNLTYTGAKDNTSILSFPQRDDNPLLMAFGIYCTAPGTKITRIKGTGRAAVVYLVNWNGTAKSGYVQNCHVEDIWSYDNNDYGVLAIGQNGAHIQNVYGTYESTEPGVSPPPHLVYISDNQPNKQMTGGDWRAYGGRTGVGAAQPLSGMAYVFKGVAGGVFHGLYADDCEGLVALLDSTDLVIDGFSATNDVCNNTSVGTIAWSTNTGNRVRMSNGSLHKADSTSPFITMFGTDGTIDNVTIAATRDGAYRDNEIQLAGIRNRITGLRYRNSGSSSANLMIFDATAGADNYIEIQEAKNIKFAWWVIGGAGSTIDYDPAHLTVGASPDTPLSLNSVATAVIRAKDHRYETVISAGGTYVQDCTLATTHVLKITTGGAVTVYDPLSASALGGREVAWEIWNATGGALGALTWDARFVFSGGAALAAPAAGKRTRHTFMWDSVASKMIETKRVALP